MKIKRKISVFSTVMIAVTTISISTATYAWFINNRSNEVSVVSTSAISEGDLEITEYTSGLLPSGSAAPYSDAVTVANSVTLTDISGNGVNFYKPTFSVTDSSAVVVRTINNNSHDGFYFESKFVLRHKKEGKIFLGPLSTIAPSNDDETTLFEAARVAVFNDNAAGKSLTTSDVKLFFSKSTTDSTGLYIMNDTINAYGNPTTGNLGASYPFMDLYFRNFNERKGVYLDAATYPGGASSGFSPTIAELTNINPTHTDEEGYYHAFVTIRVWIEGTDAAANETNLGGRFDVILQFYVILNDDLPTAP